MEELLLNPRVLKFPELQYQWLKGARWRKKSSINSSSSVIVFQLSYQQQHAEE